MAPTKGVEDASHRPQRLHATLSIERFNGRSAEVLATTPFDSAEHLADTIKHYG